MKKPSAHGGFFRLQGMQLFFAQIQRRSIAQGLASSNASEHLIC